MVLRIPEQRVIRAGDGLNVVRVLGGLLALNAQRMQEQSALTVPLPPAAVASSPRAGSVPFAIDSAGELVTLLKLHSVRSMIS
jgi:hypothetical protein